MSANQSNLSDPHYGYDFVVATTQASINSGLKEYLNTVTQPETIICFLADNLGNPTTQISLADLMTKTGGINPFDIPAGTPYNDPRITTLTQNMFIVGLKLRMGLPPGVMPVNMPPIVDLGSSANNVKFNLFCSEFTIIQNSPASGFGGQGSWNIWSQPSGTPWYFSTTVNLVYAALDNNLNTPYFNSKPAVKQALLNQLINISGSAFSLQQLLFDLDNAALQSVPTIQGIAPGSNAALILGKSFIGIYFAAMKAQGLPVLSVNAVANTPDNSTLRLTGVEREVGQLVDGNGVVIPNQTPSQKEVTTLCYLCAANNNPLPGASTFSWNWVDPADVNNESGIISINRNTLAGYYKTLLWPMVQNSCLKATTWVDAHWYGRFDSRWALIPGQTPQSAVISPTGGLVLTISYASNADANNQSGATYAELDLHTNYTCTVSFVGNTIVIVQHLVIWMKCQFDSTATSGNIVDKTITDTFTLSVGQNGSLQMSQTSDSKDDSQNIDLTGIITWFVDMNTMIDAAKAYASNIASLSLHTIPASGLQNFVFPGAKVFTYKNVLFSDHQDLLSAITYVTPS